MDGVRTDLPILERIGAYRLLKHLGANGSVQVYLARGEGSDRPSGDVVLQIVSGLVDGDAKKIEELRREAAAFCKLSHPAIIRTYEFFEHENSLVFVLEHVEGMSLAELSTTGAPQGARTFSDEAVFHAAISICDALTHAHGMSDPQRGRSPVVHKGMSPSKVRVARDGTVKLGGFGLTKPFGVSVDRKERRLQWESPYLAPEQVLGQPSSPKVDVYAAGLILWELLTGRSSATVVPKDPFAVPNAMRAMAERTLDPLAKVRPDLPRALSAAVDAALIASPEKRTIGCAELAQEIRKHSRIRGRGKEELRAKVQAAFSGAESPSSQETPEPPAPRKAPESPAPQEAPVQVATKATRAIGASPLDAQPAAAVRRPPPPVPAPPPHRAPSEAVSRLPVSPVPAAAVDTISASPIVTIGAPSHATPPPPPPAPPPQGISVAGLDRRAPPPAAPLPIDSVTSATMEVPKPADRPQGFAPALAAAELDPLDAGPAVVQSRGASAAHALSSMLGRLRAPSAWPRSARLAASVGVPLALVSLVTAIAVGRSRRSSQQDAQIATAAAIADDPGKSLPFGSSPGAPTGDVRSTVSGPSDMPSSPKAASPVQGPSVGGGPDRPVTGSPVQAPPVQVPPVQEPRAKVAAAAERTATPPAKAAKAPSTASADGEFSMALKKRRLGHLTVHSAAPYAKVYMMFTRFGKVEEKLTVPCGQRFIAIGLPPRGGRGEPVWLAPGKSMFVPCGGSLTVTMNPRRVR